MAQLQASVSFDPIASSDAFKNAPTAAQADAASRWFDDHLSKPGVPQAAMDDAKNRFLSDYVPKYNAVSPTAPVAAPKPVQMQQAGAFSPGAPGMMNYSPTSMEDLNKFNQGTLSGLSGLVKGATLGYGDPYHPNMGAQGEQLRGIPQFLGAALPFALTDGAFSKFLPGGGFMGGLARSAGSGGLMGMAESQPGNQFDFGQRLKAGAEGAITGGALHLAGELGGKLLGGFLPKEAPSPTMLKGRVVTRELPKPVTGEYGVNNRLLKGNPEQIQISKIQREAAQVIKDANEHVGIDEATTARERMRALKNAHDTLEEVAKQTENPRIKAALRKAQADLQAAHASHNYKALLREEKAAENRISDLEREGSKLKDLRQKQAIKDQIALERAESKQRKREMNQLKASIQARAKAEDAQVRQNTQAEKTRRTEANEAARQRQKEANARVRQRQEYEKGRVKQIQAEIDESNRRLKQMEAEGRKLQSQKDRQTAKNAIVLERAEQKNRARELTRLKASIKSRAVTLDQQAKQAAESDKTLNQAERENQKRAANRLKAAIKERQSEQEAQAEQQDGAKQQPKEGKQPGKQAAEQSQGKGKAVTVQTKAAVINKLKEAHSKNLEARVWYEAEGGQSRVNEERIVSEGKSRDGRTEANIKGGESFEQVHGEPRVVSIVTPVEENINGHLVYTTMDETGVPKTRHINHAESGSRTLRVELTGEKAKYDYVDNPETGKPQGLNIATGEFIEPGKSKGSAYTSTIKANLAKMKAVLESKKPSVHEIMEAAKGLDDAEVEESMKDIPKEKLDEACERLRNEKH